MISEFPLLVFTVFAGVAAGTYCVTPFFDTGRDDDKRSRLLLPIVCIVCLGIGLLGTLLHLQHPERFLNAFANPRAMIAQEAYWSIAFGIVLVVDVLLSALREKGTPRAVKAVGAFFALGLMVVTGLAYATNYGVPAWRGMATFPLFLFGDIAAGSALYAALRGGIDRKPLLVTVVSSEVVAAVSLIGFAVQLSQAGGGIALVIVALALAPCVNLACVYAAVRKTSARRILLWTAFACAFLSIAISRYAFYAACPF